MKRPFQEIDPYSDGPDKTEEEIVADLLDDLRALGVPEQELQDLLKD